MGILFGVEEIVVRSKILLSLLLISISGYANGSTCPTQKDNVSQIFEMQQKINQQNNKIAQSPKLFVFISLSMPEQSLKAWAEQTAKVEGVLLLRGFHENSIQKTTSRIKSAFEENTGAECNVDPQAFNRFQIKVVPSVVVVNEENNFDVIYGDISLETALEKMTASGSDEITGAARVFLEKYRNSDGSKSKIS